MADNVALSAALRSNLLALQKTGGLLDRTNSRLSSGLKVASAVDDAVAYFQAKGLADRAGDISTRKEGIDQGISSVKAAVSGLESVEKILVQLKGVVLSAKSATNAERTDLKTQFNTLASQLNNLANDTSYQGLNLINSTIAKLKIEFSEKSNSVLTIQGVNVQMSALNGLGATVASNVATKLATQPWSAVSQSVSYFDLVLKGLDTAIAQVRSNTKTLGTNVALLQTRLDFSKVYVTNLREGSEKLTLADLNEEGANLVSLQTRQQLGIQALSFAGQQEQGVLSLFR
ncbi:MAG: flagellin [Solirubrobacterales bacterium]